MSIAITIDSISKCFGDIVAVESLSLEVKKGEMFALVGPDGVGKTTLIRMLCTILKPDSGTAAVMGFNVLAHPSEVKKRIGYLSQKFSLYGDLTIDENIEFFAEIHGIRDYHARRDELLEFTRLTPFRDRLAEKLSGGMKQKLALACTLIHTPEVIFLDEPTTGVDPVSRRDFWKVLSTLLKSGITIVMTTPYMDEAERCHRVALMNEGKVLVTDTPAAIKAMMTRSILEIVPSNIRKSFSLLKESPLVHEVQAFGDRIHVFLQSKEVGMKEIEPLLAPAGITVADWRFVKPTLENAFISMITEQRLTSDAERH